MRRGEGLSHHPTVRLESRPTGKHVSGQDEDVVSDVKSVGVDVVEHSPSHRSNEWQLTRSVLSACADWGKEIVEFARILEGERRRGCVSGSGGFGALCVHDEMPLSAVSDRFRVPTEYQRAALFGSSSKRSNHRPAKAGKLSTVGS